MNGDTKQILRLLANEGFQRTVTNRMMDESAWVRVTALDLLGKLLPLASDDSLGGLNPVEDDDDKDDDGDGDGIKEKLKTDDATREFLNPLLLKYRESVKSRINDKGPNVRKMACKIITWYVRK